MRLSRNHARNLADYCHCSFWNFQVCGGADVSFKVALAIVIYSALPLLVKTLLALLSVLAGMSPDSFTFQNPVATNPGYFMNPADDVFLYSVVSGIDIFMIWTLVLTAIGFTCVSRVKRGTAYAIVFGWWAVFSLLGAGLAAASRKDVFILTSIRFLELPRAEG